MHIHDVSKQTIEIIARSFSNGDICSREEKKECFYFISSLKYKEKTWEQSTRSILGNFPRRFRSQSKILSKIDR